MPEYLTPGLYFDLHDAAPPVIRRVRADIAGFVGLAERGPLDQPVRIESWRQFQARFGNFMPYSFLAYVVKGFFENGGRTCFIQRVAGITAAKASLPLKHADGKEVIRIFAANEGEWGNHITVTLTQINRNNLTFSLHATRHRRDRESFPNLSLKSEERRYFVRVINEGDERTPPSQWIRAEDKIDPGTLRTSDLLPDPVESGLRNGIGFLIGGQDGLASLTKTDFLRNPSPNANGKKGLSAFEDVDAIGIVGIPDIHIRPAAPSKQPPELPPRDSCMPRPEPPPLPQPALPLTELPPIFSDTAVEEIQHAMIEHCELQKDRVALLDAPLQGRIGRPPTLAEIQQWRSKFDSERGFAALYYPWVKVVDPLHLDGSPVRPVPPCGHIAGLCARSDFTVGVHKAPANAELFWAEDVTVEVNDESQGVLNPDSINCLRPFPGRGIRVYGARTLTTNPDWRYLNVRRLLLMIEEAVDEATQWAVFEPHDFNLRQALVMSISSFLDTLWRQGALVGATAKEAFFVKCDDTNNPSEIVDQGKLIAEVGVAPAKPAEFIIFRVGRTVEEFEIVER
ncbi:MAG: phage tail sheath family protein [bacterium]